MSPTSGTCDLCGLSLGHGGFASNIEKKSFKFCCMGCRQVFMMILESSEDKDPSSFQKTELFKKCREIGIIPSSEEDLGRRNQDRTSFLSIEKDQENKDNIKENNLSLNLRVSQMWCPACAWFIEENLKKNEGIEKASCSFSTDRLSCSYDPTITSPTQIIKSIDALGYRASYTEDELIYKESQKEFIRFSISVFLTMNVMMLSFGLYSGFFTQLSQGTILKLSWPMFFMTSTVLFYGGFRIYKRAFAGIFHAAFSMETLITAGALSAYTYSVYNHIILGSIHLYYDTVCMLITLVLLGKTLEGRAKRKVQEGLENLFSLRPTKVKICTREFPKGKYVSVKILEKGSIFRITEMEILPADGIILDGKGTLDESTLTGEPVPVTKGSGDHLQAGTKVLQGTFNIRAEKIGDESVFGQMIHIMQEALKTKGPREDRTRIALQWFVPVILILAMGTTFVSLLLGLSFEEAIIRAVTVMVISCPCTLGIAIPLAHVAGIYLAGKKGILIRKFSSFEIADNISHFVFDKTGTVTSGQWKLLDIIPLNAFKKNQIVSMAVTLEKKSEHPIAIEIKAMAGPMSLEYEELENITISKNGISGERDGKEIRIGSREFIEREIDIDDDQWFYKGINIEPHYSKVYMSYDKKPCAFFLFGDKIRKNTKDTINHLLAGRNEVDLVSGDGKETTRVIGQRIGIEKSIGGMLPEDKVAFVKNIQKQGDQVAMIGDGINDAPALAQANLGISVHSGNSLNHEAADLTLMRGDPNQLIDFLMLARKVKSKIRQNLIWAFIYNIIAIPIAMSGLLTPLIAVSAMLLSSLGVIGNTLMLIKKSEQ